mmetsp:Transcript_11566/g.24975  ORF Transcript_11566/g.24975 Transcript_11566/m.24975 type:complete len:283 (-) Transcript_11566:195-1043(-)
MWGSGFAASPENNTRSEPQNPPKSRGPASGDVPEPPCTLLRLCCAERSSQCTQKCNPARGPMLQVLSRGPVLHARRSLDQTQPRIGTSNAHESVSVAEFHPPPCPEAAPQLQPQASPRRPSTPTTPSFAAAFLQRRSPAASPQMPSTSLLLRRLADRRARFRMITAAARVLLEERVLWVWVSAHEPALAFWFHCLRCARASRGSKWTVFLSLVVLTAERRPQPLAQIEQQKHRAMLFLPAAHSRPSRAHLWKPVAAAPRVFEKQKRRRVDFRALENSGTPFE